MRYPGEKVSIDHPKYPGIWVVDRVNVAKLGGDGGRYVRAVRRNLVSIDATEVLAAIA